MLGNPGSGVLLTPGLAGHKLGPGQCPVRSPLAAGTAIWLGSLLYGVNSFSSMVALKRGKILLTLGCCVCAEGKKWRLCQNLNITGSGAEVWERMESLHGSKGKGENGVSDCGSHKSCRYRP